jgi:hypothetical protein
MDDSFLHFYRSLGRADRTPEVESALAEVVRNRPELAATIQRETAFDSVISAAMVSVPVPAGLHLQLLQKAYARRGAALRNKIYQGLTAIAFVVVAGLIAGGLYWQYRPKIDGEAIAHQQQMDREESQLAVETWLEKNDLPNNLPRDFDYRYYSFHGKGELGGKDIPVVQFQAGREFARVYIVRESALNTESLKDAQASLCNVLIVHHPEPGVKITYVIVYTTDKLEPFLRQVGLPPV